IHTVGSGSRGMLAQSIGGGGGTAQGGTMNLSVGFEGIGGSMGLGLGQTGGDGGAAGAVSANIDGAIRTEGGDADGVMLQSIGGGGGLGGSIGADSSSNPILDRIGVFQGNKSRLTDAGQAYTFNVDLGGRGGKGGHGGDIDVDFSGKIATRGDWADGIVAQSIGGGGGTGGSSTASGSSVTANLAFAIGGKGGAAGNGGAITAYFDGRHNNSILTEGYSAYGVLLQSIGGGGGQGGDGSDKAAGTFTIGGSDGGNGGTSGTGGTIQLRDNDSWLTVHTKGSDSPALAAQSIGGGGGMGGAGNSDSTAIIDSHAISISVGGHGGTGNHGGSVSLTQGLAASTQGDRAYGLLAQSIGGGGGVGNAGEAGNITNLTLGGRGGAGGDGGTVALTLNKGSYIHTKGAGAHGIIAQSIGGGGGIAGDSSLNMLLGTSRWITGTKDATETGGNGSGNTVNIAVNDSEISTTGPNAYGIFAQSIGGGGGLVGDSDGGYAGTTSTADNGSGRGGAVNVTQSGSIEALGANSVGIFAQSEGPEGGGAIRVDLHGNVSGGTGEDSYGVWIVDGKKNDLNIYDGAQVAGGEGASATAIRYDGSGSGYDGYNLTVTNFGGTIKGSIYCSNASGHGDAACEVFGNRDSLMTDATLYQANIDNAGTVVVGRPGMVDTLTVTGNYTQQASGVLQTTVDFEKLKAGRMVLRGDAQLDGHLDLTTLSLLPDRELTVLSVQGNTSGAMQAMDSPIFDFHTRQAGQDHKVSVRGADFAASSQKLSRSQREVADHLQRVWDDKGTHDLAKLFGVLNQASKQGAGTYRERLSDLSPGATLAPAAQMVDGMGRFTDAMMSCPVMEGDGTDMRERNCFWGQVTRRSTNQDASDGYSGFSFDSTTYQIGGQREFRPDWFVGGSVAYQNNHMDSDDGRSGGKGDAGYAGVVLKRQNGPWVFSGALGGGYGSYDMSRGLNIDGYQRQASGDPDVYSFGARLRAARHIEVTDQFYLKPYVDLEALYTRMPGYTESGDALSLKVSSSDQFVLSLSPMLEVGGRVDLPKGATMRPFAYAGASFLSEDAWNATARLKGAPAGGSGMNATLPGDDLIGRFGAGLQINNASGLDFRLQYDGQISSKSTSHAGQLKVMYRY
ncbi:MAG: autotransporter domain-containing protein, partial [Pusillimonas sp.]